MPTTESDKTNQKKIHSKVELYLLYPISPLLALRRSLSWVLTFFLILGTILIATYAYKKSGLELNEVSLQENIHNFLIFAVIVIIAKIIFEYLLIRNYHFRVGDGNFTISRGLFFKSGVSIPLSKITDFYFRQNIFDLVFGLTDFHINTPSSDAGAIAQIDGLKNRDAISLRKRLEEIARLARIEENSSGVQNP